MEAGILPVHWSMDGPFEFIDKDDKESFRKLIRDAFSIICDGKVLVQFELELNQEDLEIRLTTERQFQKGEWNENHPNYYQSLDLL